jgi:hypothetical protein
MEVGDEEEALLSVLPVDESLERTEMVAEGERAAGRDA